jgi:hypothetical protein
VSFAFQRGKLVLAPKVAIDRSQFPNADDEYTSAQRRIIDARLDESDDDLKKVRGFGRFGSAEDMIAHMKAQLKRSAVKKTERP